MAVRLYGNFALGPDNADALNALLAKEDLPVVALWIDQSVDDHRDLAGIEADRIITYQARESFSTISSVVAHANKFICTYGGLSYLGPLYGVPTVAVTDLRARFGHEEQERRMIAQVDGSYERLCIA